MVARVLLIVAAANVALASPAVNSLMDRVLSDLRYSLRSQNLDPARAYPFRVLVPKNGPFNSDFRANFTQGSLVGLSGLVRTGDCSYGRSGANMMFGCNVLLGSAQFLMNADVQGDSGSKVHSISINTGVNKNTYALIQVRGPRGYRAQLDSIRVPSVTATTRVIQGSLDLNGGRFSEFSRQVNENISVQLVNTLSGVYAQALNQALTRYTMP